MPPSPLSIDPWAFLWLSSLERQLCTVPSRSFSLLACLQRGCQGRLDLSGLCLLQGSLRPLPPEGSLYNSRLPLLGVTAPSFSPHQAAQAPEVTYEADKGSTWTLLLTNLGGYLGCTGLLCLPHLPGARALGSWGRGPVEISSSFRRSGERWQSPQSAGLFVCRWTPAGAGCRVCPLAGVSTWGGAAGQAYREALASWEGLPLNFSLRPTVD